MTFFGFPFRSRKSDNHSVTASYTPIEQNQSLRRQIRKKTELVPTAIQFKIVSDNSLDEENLPSQNLKESREETSTKRSSLQEKQIPPKLKEPVPLPPTVQIPARQDTTSLPEPEPEPKPLASTSIKPNRKVQFDSEDPMHEPRLSGLVELRKHKIDRKPKRSSKASKSSASDENTLESLPPFIEFSNSDVSPMGKIPTYSERRKSKQLHTYDVTPYGEDREPLAGCGGPEVLLRKRSKALEGVYNNIMTGELVDGVYKRYQDMKIPMSPNIICNDQSTLNACHTEMDRIDDNSIVESGDRSRVVPDDCHTNLDNMKCTGVNANYLNEQTIQMACGNDDINRTDSSFSNDSLSDSEYYEESYPGFYNFVSDLFVQGIKNPIQAVTGFADETCHTGTSTL